MSQKKGKPEKTYTYPNMTTIAVTKKNAVTLDGLKRGRESYDDVLARLFVNSADVYVEFLLIDNELPGLHTAVFQLGDDKNSLYFWNGEKIEGTSLEETNKLLKQPKTEGVIIDLSKLDKYLQKGRNSEMLRQTVLVNIRAFLEDNRNGHS